MEWFLPRDRLNATPVDFRHPLCSMDTDNTNPTGRIRPHHSRPLHPARPTTERALYVMFAIALFFVGVAIYLYAHLSWLFVVVSAVFVAVNLPVAKYLGDNRSREELATAFKLGAASFSIYWLLLAVFGWLK